MAAHTPGPWHVAQGSDERDFIVAENSGNTVCEPNAEAFGDGPSQFDPKVRHIDLAEAKANARLIAAAPELLDSLKEMADMLHLWMRDNTGPRELAVLERCEHALAKAEGRP